MTKASDYPELYERLGLSTNRCGAVMLNTEPIPVARVLDPAWLVVSDHPKAWYVKGALAEHGGHATVLYGFLIDFWPNWEQYTADIDTVLEGWEPPATLTPERISVFPGDPNGPVAYDCIVAELDTAVLAEGRARLGLLPHIDTFSEYRAHITLAYVDPRYTEQAVAALEEAFFQHDLTVKTTGLTPGGRERWEENHTGCASAAETARLAAGLRPDPAWAKQHEDEGNG